jgi:hypothetical protein
MDQRAPHELMIEAFVKNSLMKMLHQGSSMALPSVTLLASVMQQSAAYLFGLDGPSTIALLRAYANVMESGGPGPTYDAAVAEFMQAAQCMIAAVQAHRDFPTPQGRA